MPAHGAIFQHQPPPPPPPGNCSPPPGLALSCLGVQSPGQGPPVGMQVQDAGEVGGGGSLLQAGRGMPMSPSANQLQMHQRASLLASLTYGHRPLSKQLSADSAESHR